MKWIKLFIAFLDDILFTVGSVCIIHMGFIINAALGWGVMGAVLITSSFLIAKGGGRK